MSEYIKRAKEHERIRRLLEDFFNRECGDNSLVYDLEFKRRSDGPEVLIKYTSEFILTEDEFEELIEKIDSR